MVYVKLAIRNAKRSIYDYLLYIITAVLLFLFLIVANYVALAAEVEAGFQSASLPLLISLILIVLVSYINAFMLKQRAKEFANYLLLGMRKRNLIKLVLCEFSIIGCFCLLISSFLSFLVCAMLLNTILPISSSSMHTTIFVQSMKISILYILGIETISFCAIQRQIKKNAIYALMMEQKRNDCLGKKSQCNGWGTVLLLNALILLLYHCGMLLLSDQAIMMLSSVISVPLMATIFSFYPWCYRRISLIRQRQPLYLFEENRYYLVTQMLQRANTNAILHGIFCLCLLLSSISFMVGVMMLQADLVLFEQGTQLWMGFLQICLCIIFIVIYFSVLSLHLLIDLRSQKREFGILHYLGKRKKQLNRLLFSEIILKLCFPASLCFVLLGIAVPFVNARLNHILPAELNNFCIRSWGSFIACFMLFCLLYVGIVYCLSKHIIEAAQSNKHAS